MMGFVCAVADCSNCQSGITEGYRPYFRFPINRRELCEQWIIECRRTDKFNPADFRVCPDHFSADDFERDVESELLHRMRLKPDAVPRLHPNRLKIEEDEDEILPDSGRTTSEKVIQPSFNLENGGCVVCGDLNCLSIQSYESDLELMKAWRAGWAKSLCKMLDVGSGYEETFFEGKFCSRCQEMVCKGESAMNFLQHLQDQLKEVERTLQQLFHNKDSIKIESCDEFEDDDMESIMKSVRFDRLNYNWTPPTVDYNWTPPAAVTSAIDPLGGFGEDGLIPVKKRQTISRLKELKQRQEHRPPTSPLTASRRGPGRPRKKVVDSQPMEIVTDPVDGVHNTALSPAPLTTVQQVSLEETELKIEDDDFGDLGPHQFQNLFASFMQLDETETRDVETEGGEDLNLHATELESPHEDLSTNAPARAKQKQLQNAFPDWRLPQSTSRYICNHPDCFSRDLYFSRPTLVRTHCQTEHPGQGLDLTPYHCSNCQERFVTVDNLRLHKIQTHPELDPNKYGCPFCAQKFHSSGSLGTHLRYCKSNNTSTKAKTEPKPAKVKIPPCPICGKTFEWPEEAEHHATLHGKDEPRKQKTCVMCSSVDKPKVFRSKAELRRHVNFSHNIPKSIPRRVLSKGKRAKKASLRLRLNRARIVMQIRRSEREHLKKDVIFCNFPKCMASNAIFSSRLRLRTHLRTEHKFTVLEALCTYHCDKCELRFEHSSQLDEHKRRAKFDPRHDPEDPDDLFWSSTEREESADRPKRTGKTADQAKPKLPTENYTSFLCSECGYFCKFNWQLQYHIQINHSATGVIKCKLCGKCFRGSQKEKEDAVRSHELLHSDDNVFGCVFCDKNLRSTIELAQHVRDVHEDFPFKCNEEGCGKGFELEVQYQKHMKNHAANARVYKCKECDFIARRSKGLHYHSIAKHSTEHKFPCTFEGCQRTFKFQLRRTLHLRRVHGVGVTQLYKCRICAMEFVVASSLTKHEQCHSKERPFICEICSASFKCKATLRQHYRVHNPDKKTGNNWKLQQPRKPRLKSSEAERLAHRMLEKAKAAKKTSTQVAAGTAVTGQIAESAEDTSAQAQQNNIPMSGTESASSLNLQQQVSCSSTVAQGHLPEVLPPGTSSLVEPSPALQHWHPPYPPTNLELSTVDPRIWQHFANYKNTPF